MGKSRKRKTRRSKQDKRKKRKPGAKRLPAIDRIERARATKPEPAVAAAPRQAPTVRIDPAAAEGIAEARRMGLSVADDASADRVEHLLERFALAAAYVRDVWAALSDGAGLSDEQLNHVAAGLFADGRVADGVIGAQKQRQGDPAAVLHRDAHFRIAAKALREHFGHLLPTRSLWSRLLGR